MFDGFMNINLKKEMACGEIFHAGYFIRWSCRFAPAPSGETVPVWAGCTQSAHPSHTRTGITKF